MVHGIVMHNNCEGMQELTKYWETEVTPTVSQITDVQGRLKQNISFSHETLHVPPHPKLHRKLLSLTLVPSQVIRITR